MIDPGDSELRAVYARTAMPEHLSAVKKLAQEIESHQMPGREEVLIALLQYEIQIRRWMLTAAASN